MGALRQSPQGARLNARLPESAQPTCESMQELVADSVFQGTSLLLLALAVLCLAPHRTRRAALRIASLSRRTGAAGSESDLENSGRKLLHRQKFLAGQLPGSRTLWLWQVPGLVKQPRFHHLGAPTLAGLDDSIYRSGRLRLLANPGCKPGFVFCVLRFPTYWFNVWRVWVQHHGFSGPAPLRGQHLQRPCESCRGFGCLGGCPSSASWSLPALLVQAHSKLPAAQHLLS